MNTENLPPNPPPPNTSVPSEPYYVPIPPIKG